MRIQLYDKDNKPTVRGTITQIDHYGKPNLTIELDGGAVQEVNFTSNAYHNAFFNCNRVPLQMHESEEMIQGKLFR